MIIDFINYILRHRKISIRNGMDLHEKIERGVELNQVELEYCKLNILRRRRNSSTVVLKKTWNARIHRNTGPAVDMVDKQGQ